MEMQTTQLDLHQQVWEKYRSNLPRYLIGLSRYTQSQTMHVLIDQLGYKDLKLNYDPFFSLMSDEGCRLTELAEWLGITKQSCNRTASQIKKAGYLTDKPDPTDGRAKILVLTEKGRKLVMQAAEVVQAVEAGFERDLGTDSYRQLVQLLTAFYVGLDLPQVRINIPGLAGNQVLLANVLPRLSEYVMHRLMDLTRARGHADLKISHGQVLSLIGLSGGRIQQIAKINEVSKQAISAIAKELEQLGYIRQAPDPDDARSVVLMFTDRGLKLLADSVASLADVEQEMIPTLGQDGINRLEELSECLYRSLHLEEEVFQPQLSELSFNADKNLQVLANSLKQQLGHEAAKELGQLLLSRS